MSWIPTKIEIMRNDIVGIDLGTTNSLIGVMDVGFPVLIADANGSRITPSIVHFPPDNEPLVGQPAARVRSLHPNRTVHSIKRLIGLRGNEYQQEDTRFLFPIVRERGRPLRVVIDGRSYSPEDISAMILMRLKANAERALGRPLSRAVITVPAYFNDAQRSATKRAGELAGFSVERIVNEPTAAALAYGLDKLQARSKIAVYDFGGGTFDISLLELNNGVFEVLATNGNSWLGGDDIDQAVVTFLVNQGCPADNPETLARLHQAAVTAKHRLSLIETTTVEIPFLKAGTSFSTVLSRATLEEISRPIVEQTRFPCLRSLSDAQLTPADLDQIILVGGATRMPLVRQVVREIFGREPNTQQNPDETVALGATIQGGILAGTVHDVVLLDVTPLSLGIETFGGLMNVIIPRNSTIPIKAGEMFTTAVHHQRFMSIKVLQGEREMARDNWTLGEFEIEFPPAPKGVARVGIQFEIDANGILHILARDTQTGLERRLAIDSAVDVSDQAVEAMISDSIDHAFDDMSERVWTETKLKAEEMLRAVDAALGQVGETLSPAETERIRVSAARVQEALKKGDTRSLQAANAALDEATQSLATTVLERAIQSTK